MAEILWTRLIIMKINRIIMMIIGCLALFSLPANAETPILEELMRKYTFPLIFLSLLGGVLTVGYLYVTGLLPKVIFRILEMGR